MMSPSELHFAPKKIKLDVREISVSTQLAPLHRSLFILFLLMRQSRFAKRRLAPVRFTGVRGEQLDTKLKHSNARRRD